jgi:hypothetical protein
MTCAWRGVLDGSDEAKNAQRLPNTIFFDLCHLLGRAEGGALVHLARTGEAPVQEPRTATTSPASGRHVPRMPYESAVAAAADPSRQTEPPRPRAIGGSYELLPELARLMPAAGTDALYAEAILNRQRRKTRWVLVTTLFAACLLSLSIAGLLVFLGFVSLKTGADSDIPAGRKTDEDWTTTGLTKAQTERAADRAQNTEKSDSEAGTRARSERIGPVPPQQERFEIGQVPLQPENASKEQKPTSSVAVAPVKPTPPDRKSGPLVLFVGLPPAPGRQSRVAGVKRPASADAEPVESTDRVFPKRYTQFNQVLNMTEVFKPPDPGETLKLETKSISGLSGRIAVATMKIADGKPFSFRWDSELVQSSRKDELTLAVRDIVLKLRSKDGDGDYLLLRDPNPINSDQPFDLKNDRAQQLDHLHKRYRTFNWASEKAALDGTKWKLGIVRWRIVNRLSKNGQGRTIGSGEQRNGKLKDTFVHSINYEDAKLFIRINHDERHRIDVGLDFDSNFIRVHHDRRDRLFHDFDINLKRRIDSGKRRKEPREDSPHTPLEVHESLEKLEMDLQTELTQYNNMTISKADLYELRKIVSKEILYNFLDNSEVSELSVIIGLRLDDGTVLDIARIGTFVDSHP